MLTVLLAVALSATTIAGSVSVVSNGTQKEHTEASQLEEALDTAHDTRSSKQQTAAGIRRRATEGQKDGELHIFVFVGHGAGNTDPKGALVGSDKRGVTADELADTLGGRNGTTVMILDSCYSGDVAQRAAARCVTILTSGSPGEACKGGGSDTFSRHVAKGLRGEADADNDGTVTLGELDDYLKREYDDETRTHQCNATQKGTRNTILARYMKYEVIDVTGEGSKYYDDPSDEDWSALVEEGETLRDCMYIRVPAGATVKVKKKLGCGNEYTLGPGAYHLGTLRPKDGSGYVVDVFEGEMTITEGGLCDEHDHCGSQTDAALAYPIETGPTPESVTNFTTHVCPEDHTTTIANSAESYSPLRVIPLSTPYDDGDFVLEPGESAVIPYTPWGWVDQELADADVGVNVDDLLGVSAILDALFGSLGESEDEAEAGSTLSISAIGDSAAELTFTQWVPFTPELEDLILAIEGLSIPAEPIIEEGFSLSIVDVLNLFEQEFGDLAGGDNGVVVELEEVVDPDGWIYWFGPATIIAGEPKLLDLKDAAGPKYKFVNGGPGDVIVEFLTNGGGRLGIARVPAGSKVEAVSPAGSGKARIWSDSESRVTGWHRGEG